MTERLDRSNTATTFSSFFHPSRKPSLKRETHLSPSPPRQHRPPPPPNYRHVDDDDDGDPPTAFTKLEYPRSRSVDLRASKLELVEHLSARERIERWNGTGRDRDEVELTPLDKWRIRVADEVAKERRREEAHDRQQQERDGRSRGLTTDEPDKVEGDLSVLTTSSIKSATAALRNQFESSSPFARSFAVDNLETPVTVRSEPSSSVVRESFLCDLRPERGDHPYAHTFAFDEKTGTLVTAPPRPVAPSEAPVEETLLVPSAPETCASGSPVDPAFAPANYKFPVARQRHPLPRLDTSNPPVTSTCSNSPVSAPVVSTYQSFARPPRTSSLPFHDLQSVQLSPPSTAVPPPVPPKDTPVANGHAHDPSFALLPPKAAALLGLIPTATPRPPRPPFARRHGASGSSSASGGGPGSPSTGQYRSSFYTNYDGPSRPSVDSSTPTTTLTSPSTLHRYHPSNASSRLVVEHHKPPQSALVGGERGTGTLRAARPPPLTFHLLRREGMSSLPDLHSASMTTTTSAEQHRGRGPPPPSPSSSSSVSTSLDLSLRGHSSLDTPRSTLFLPGVFASHSQTHGFEPGQEGAEDERGQDSEVESLLDAAMNPSTGRHPGPRIIPSPRTLEPVSTTTTTTTTSRLVRSISQRSKRLLVARKQLSFRDLRSSASATRGSSSGSGPGRSHDDEPLPPPLRAAAAAELGSSPEITAIPTTTKTIQPAAAANADRYRHRNDDDEVQKTNETTKEKQKNKNKDKKKKSFRDLKLGFENKLETSFRYW